jgi:hypothetical protein
MDDTEKMQQNVNAMQHASNAQYHNLGILKSQAT